jgi:hypothetical protein
MTLESEIWKKERVRRFCTQFLFVFIGFFIVGIVPFLFYNYTNSGGLLNSTYSPNDASSPSLSVAIILANIRYYFWECETAGFVDFSIVFSVFVTPMACFYWKQKALRNAAIAASLSLSVSCAFFLTHRVIGFHYLMPAASFSLALPVFVAAGIGWTRPPLFWSPVFVVIVLELFAITLGHSLQP